MYTIVVTGVDLNGDLVGKKRVLSVLGPLISSKSIAVANVTGTMISGIACSKNTFFHNGITFYLYPYTKSNVFSVLKFLFGEMKCVIGSAASKKKILYVYGYLDAFNIMSVLLAKVLGYKILFDIVEDNRLVDQSVNMIYRLRIKTSIMLSILVKYIADMFLSISTKTQNLIQQLFRASKPSLLLPVAVDCASFEKDITLPKNSVQIIWGGTIAFSHEMKSTKDGIEELIDAFGELIDENVILNITGGGDDQSLDHLSFLISKSPARDRIKYHGYVDADEYNRILLNSSIAVMNRVNTPFANAGFPYKLAEYAPSGLSIIATDVGDVTTYFSNGVSAIIIPPSSRFELVEAMRCLIRSSDLRKDLGEKARDVSNRHFSSEAISKRFIDFIKSNHEID